MPTHAKITLFDVPGESILLQTEKGHVFLVDGGLDTTVLEKISDTLPFWNKTIDGLFLSHPDTDHIGGVKKILDTFSVKNVFLSGAHHDSEVFRDLLETLERKNIPVIFLHEHQDIKYSHYVFDTIFPFGSILGKNISQGNNFSLVIRLNNKENSILFTGDIEKKTENNILVSSKKLSSDILKVPHHGSKSSSSEDFLHAIHPEKAVISASKNNPFSHPHQETLDRFDSLLVPYEVTGYTGDIIISFSSL